MSDYPRKLHLGCGLITPQGWLNVDGSWNARLAKHSALCQLLKTLRLLPTHAADIPWSKDVFIHDVREPLPFSSDYFIAVYASHLLEHLYLEEATALLRECFRVLRPGGVLRIVVPDLRAIILEYLGEKPFGTVSSELESMSPADRLNRRFRLRDAEPPLGNVIYRVYTALKDFHSHKWMYDADSLYYYFSKAGFVEIQEMQFRQSQIEGIEEVEDPGRVLNGAGICVEGIKPGKRS